MNWFQAISELCLHIDCDDCIRTILDTAADENMLTLDEVAHIVRETGISYIDKRGKCPYGVKWKGCTGNQGPWCGYCQAENS